MKKFAIASIIALASTAALSQVAITGGLNVGVAHDGTTTSLGSNQSSANHITFTATEALGQGLKVSAELNMRFDPTSGEQTRAAENVSLAVDGAFGQVKAGRFTNVVAGPIGTYSPFGTDVNGNATTLVPTRNNSTIAYTTPNFGGLRGAISRSFDSGTVGATDHGTEVAVTYSAGPLSVLVGYTETLSKADTVKSYAVAYDLGVARVSGIYADGKTQDQTSLGVAVPMGAVTLKGGYLVTDQAGAADVKRIAVGANYTLSKRTMLIADMNKDTDVDAAYYVGLRHTF
jgi:predicted porin